MIRGSSRMEHPRVVRSIQCITIKPNFQPHFFFCIDDFTAGPPSDGGYEYLLKQWIQSGDPKARRQCKAKKLILNSFFKKKKNFQKTRYHISSRHH